MFQFGGLPAANMPETDSADSCWERNGKVANELLCKRIIASTKNIHSNSFANFPVPLPAAICTVCFSGHIGGGKSSELEHLRHTLETWNRPTKRRYYPIFLDTLEYLDRFDVAVLDILLAIVAKIGDLFRDKLGINLQESFFANRFREIKDLNLTDKELKELELSLGFLKTKIQPLQQEPDTRRKVREALMPHMASLLNTINLVFQKSPPRTQKRKPAAGEIPSPT